MLQYCALKHALYAALTDDGFPTHCSKVKYSIGEKPNQ